MYRYLSGFVKNHCKSSIFSIYETIQKVDYDIYPWPNEKNCNGNGIHLACDVNWKRNNLTKFSNLLDSCITEEKQFENNLVFRSNFGGECTNVIEKYDEIFLDYNEEKDECLVKINKKNRH